MQAIRRADGSIDYDHYRTEAARLRQQAKADAVTVATLWAKRGFFSLLRRATGSVRLRYGFGGQVGGRLLFLKGEGESPSPAVASRRHALPQGES